MQEKDAYITRLRTQVSQTTRAELWNSLNVGEYIFDESLQNRSREMSP